MMTAADFEITEITDPPASLSPAGRIAFTVAKSRAFRGDDVGPNVVAALLIEMVRVGGPRAAYYERSLCDATADWPLNPEQEWCSGLKGHTGDHESASYMWTNQ
jgi:hypothetical protein